MSPLGSSRDRRMGPLHRGFPMHNPRGSRSRQSGWNLALANFLFGAEAVEQARTIAACLPSVDERLFVELAHKPLKLEADEHLRWVGEISVVA